MPLLYFGHSLRRRGLVVDSLSVRMTYIHMYAQNVSLHTVSHGRATLLSCINLRCTNLDTIMQQATWTVPQATMDYQVPQFVVGGLLPLLPSETFGAF
jgi:hypothetical protein